MVPNTPKGPIEHITTQIVWHRFSRMHGWDGMGRAIMTFVSDRNTNNCNYLITISQLSDSTIQSFTWLIEMFRSALLTVLALKPSITMCIICHACIPWDALQAVSTTQVDGKGKGEQGKKDAYILCCMPAGCSNQIWSLSDQGFKVDSPEWSGWYYQNPHCAYLSVYGYNL